ASQDAPASVEIAANGPKSLVNDRFCQPPDLASASPGTPSVKATCSSTYSRPVISTEPITASGTLRLGLLLSPASSMPCRKPRNEKVMPAVEIAMKMPWLPNGAKPCEV